MRLAYIAAVFEVMVEEQLSYADTLRYILQTRRVMVVSVEERRGRFQHFKPFSDPGCRSQNELVHPSAWV